MRSAPTCLLPLPMATQAVLFRMISCYQTITPRCSPARCTSPASRMIERLILGLPVHNMKKYAGALSERFTGMLDYGSGHVNIEKAVVIPQPLGSLVSASATGRQNSAGTAHTSLWTSAISQLTGCTPTASRWTTSEATASRAAHPDLSAHRRTDFARSGRAGRRYRAYRQGATRTQAFLLLRHRHRP